ncbi:MAG: DUF4347 domain-containing protein [Cyanobacteria bacterium P01_F01_bin.53]
MTITAPTLINLHAVSAGVNPVADAVHAQTLFSCIEKPSHLIFIDSGVDSPEVLLNGLLPTSRAFILSAGRDCIAQISEILTQFQAVQSVHIVAHGTSGSLQLGTTQLTVESLNGVYSWKAALAEDAQLVLHSCHVAEGDRGEDFVQKLSEVLGIDVAASTTLVGSENLGGHWQPDYLTSAFLPAMPFSQAALEAYPHTLAFTATLQAEKAARSGATFSSMNSGSQGGYLDFQNASGDFIEWTINAPKAGKYNLAWRYSNGASNRPLTFQLNGKTVSNKLSFHGTGAWKKWAFRNQSVTLKAGINKIRLRANGSSGANFDYLRVTEVGSSSGGSGGGNSNPPSGGGNTGGNTGSLNVALQAENARVSGATIASLNGGAQGGRYVDYKNAKGDFIEWTVNAPTAGNHTLSWRYANGASNRPLALVLNGKTVNNKVAFGSTGSWRTWGTQKQTVSLKAGVNKILLRANGSSGANIDSLTVTKGGNSSGGNTNPGGGNTNPGGGNTNPGGGGISTVGIGRIEAEKMTLSGYTVENSRISSGGKVINTAKNGTARTKFTGSKGKYDLAVVYNDENDGKSPVSVRVDGKVVASWTFNERTDSTIATTSNTRRRVMSGVSLNAGSVIEIRGAKNQNEFARIDYLDISKAGSGSSGGGSGGSGGGKLRVLALGDSNTRGEGTLGGYRTKFWQRARAAGVAIDMVGPRNDGPSSLGDKDHFGRGGWSIPQMTSWVRAGNLSRENPDIVMFMMGTNDANTNGNVSGRAIRDRLSTFIDVAVKAAPRATFFISTIMPLDTPRGTAAEAKAARDFNALIPALVRQKAKQGKKVIFANAGGSLNVGDVNGDRSRTDDRNDGLHATRAGYNKLGDAWYNAVSRSAIWKNAAAAQKRSGSIPSDAVTDPLTGDSGNNYLSGGSGFDLLTGAGGADTFTYVKPADGLDTITDFSSNDTIRVLKSGFGGDLVAGRALGGNDFVLGRNPSAKDGGSTFLFNTKDRILSFDADGKGSGAAVGLAKLSNGFTLQASQISVV